MVLSVGEQSAVSSKVTFASDTNYDIVGDALTDLMVTEVGATGLLGLLSWNRRPLFILLQPEDAHSVYGVRLCMGATKSGTLKMWHKRSDQFKNS